MQLYCKPINGVLTVLAVHTDDDTTSPSSYGDGVTVLPYDGPLTVAQMVGKAAPAVDLTAYAAARRWQVETGGIAFGTTTVASDDRAKLLLMGARLAAESDPTFKTVWQALDGSAHALASADVIALSNTLLKHVADCFSAYTTIKAGLAAVPPTIATTADVDAEFLPLELSPPPAAAS